MVCKKFGRDGDEDSIALNACEGCSLIQCVRSERVSNEMELVEDDANGDDEEENAFVPSFSLSML